MQCLPDRRRFLARRLLLTSASFLMSVSLSLGSATTSRAETSIVVGTQTPYNVGLSGSDDLGDLKKIYQSANSPSEQAFDQFNQIITDTGMKRTRLLLSDIYCDVDQTGNVFGYTQDGVFHPGDCQPLGWHLQWALDRGLSPHVAVAAFMPPRLVQYGPGESWDPNGPAPALFRKYAEALVRYIAKKSFDGGASSVIFEVSNETDIADSAPENWSSTNPAAYTLKPLGSWGRWLWWMDPAKYVLNQWPPLQSHVMSNADDPTLSYPYQLDARRLPRQLLPVQKVFSQAIDTIRAELAGNPSYSGKTLEMSGPALVGLSFLYYPAEHLPTLEEVFLDQTFNPLADTYGAKFNARLDRFSFHYYGSTDGTGGFAFFDNLVDKVRGKLASLKAGNASMPDVKLFLSEWGPTAYEETDVNYSHKGAAWTAAFLSEAVKKKISMGSYLIIGDGQGDPRITPFLGQASLLHKVPHGDNPADYYPKPVANLFKMYNKMSGQRVQAALTGGSDSHLNAFATWDGSNATANIMLYNYDATRVFGSNTSTEVPEAFSLAVDNLPFSNGPVTVERYLIDANNSNLARFLVDSSRSPDLQKTTLTGTVTGGKLTLSDSLGLGVSLYRVLPPH
ncbi:hypothetical protein [Bradyrhizobium sp. CCGB20]|uniref:hypothetical protein n=1 Tax=Bradyrhizobium sp. CCGB20 TaxID=2949633 RepID=UPI0020B2C536|nr:hypothetical protein [Bradyrhizobium sp. CCGB20]MCP3399285.1 hypothetical protein [Bradyrhizobium sp. CCGB20]